MVAGGIVIARISLIPLIPGSYVGALAAIGLVQASSTSTSTMAVSTVRFLPALLCFVLLSDSFHEREFV